MNDPDGRYAEHPSAEWGEERVRYTPRRLLEPASEQRRARALRGERQDQIADEAFGEPRGSWRLWEAAAVLHPDEVGRDGVIEIPEPGIR